MIKGLVNAITQIQDKTTNATQDQTEFEGESKTYRISRMTIEREQ